MTIEIHKYQGAGNDFILIDNRKNLIKLSKSKIAWLCNRNFGVGADGLILLNKSSVADFEMEYYNSDGKTSTMCGNGGRCVVMFAKQLNIIKKETLFNAIDGIHYAEVLRNDTVKLQMVDVNFVKKIKDNFELNTGSPHYIKFIKKTEDIQVPVEGKKIRNNKTYKTKGINVNFVAINKENNINIRTYERGVENETLACGTGVTAAAIAYKCLNNKIEIKNSVTVNTLGGLLYVSFKNNGNYSFSNIFLTGKANFVFTTIIKF